MIKKTIYLDHAAITPLEPKVLQAMLPYLKKKFGNPSSLYGLGLEAKKAIEDARLIISKILNCLPEEIIFEGSGTEADNHALIGAALANRAKGNHLITSVIEHHAILHACEFLETQGFEVTYIPVNKDGLVNLDMLSESIRPETILVSIMYANNEIGTIEPIKKISEIIKEKNSRILFQTDACQAAGYLSLEVNDLGVDLMAINGSKIYGPKGVGMLYLRRGLSLEPIVFGGGQEKGLRSGTENLAGIVGFAKALELAQKNRKRETARLATLQNYFFKQILKNVSKVFINGDLKNRLPNNVNVSILDIEGEAVLLYLDEAGISASTGSACDSSRLEPSHVILALGRPYEYAHGSLRFTMGKETSKKEIDYTVKVLEKVVEKLRKISPLNIMPEREKLFCPSRIFVQSGRPHWERNKKK